MGGYSFFNILLYYCKTLSVGSVTGIEPGSTALKSSTRPIKVKLLQYTINYTRLETIPEPPS